MPERKHIYPYILLGVSLVVLAAIVFDTAIGKAGLIANPVVLAVATLMTRYGEADWCLVISFILVLKASAFARLSTTLKDRCYGVFISTIGLYAFSSIALSGLASNLLKRMFGRGRPGQFGLDGAFNFTPFASNSQFESFPSGHATTMGAVLMVLFLIMPKYRLTFLVLALWFGMTRVVVGAHYPSDVVAGLCFGAGFAWLVARLFACYGLGFRLDTKGMPILRQKLLK
ncbi:phosphatase PAP2 family protein [Rhizobium sp.]|uniref:phosphatase PAP2 family protein n=1 Tax=Rhizobium sp. TaxID=391 RepID=UPI002AA64FE5